MTRRPLAALERFFFGPIDARVPAALRIGLTLAFMESLYAYRPALLNMLSSEGIVNPAARTLLHEATKLDALYGWAREGASARIVLALVALASVRMLASKADGSRSTIERTAEMGLAAFAFFATLHFVPEPARYFVLYGFTWIAAVIALVGLRTAPAATWLFFWSLLVRNEVPNAMSGWDTLLSAGFFFLAFTSPDERFSLASRGRDAASLEGARVTAWPLQMIRFQLAAVYVATAVGKLRIPEWLDGTYMIYVLIGDYARFPTEAWAREPVLASLGMALTYGTLAVELLVPVSLFFERTRRWAIALGLTLHVGILVMMAVPHFSLVISSFYAAALRGRDFDDLGAWLERRRATTEPAGGRAE